MARSQVQYGSSGVAVKELQQILNKSGYNLSEDGIFGSKTQAAVKDYQMKNGLSVDGIVGLKTWDSLLKGTASPSASGATKAPTPSAPTAAPKPAPAPNISAPSVSPMPTAPTYDTTTWGETEKGKESWDAYSAAKDAVNNHGPFQYSNQAQLDAIMNSILNREKFSYDFNEDAFYHQYKDKFTKQGKMAMQDTMGQAAAMTGGYGNSYAATAGNQAYQASLENLNDIIPELYQMAYDRYNQEGQDLYNKYGLLQSDYDRAYGEHSDQYNRLMDALGIARGDYYDGANLFHTEQNNKNSLMGQTFNDAMNIWQNETNNAWREAEFNNENAWRQTEYDNDNAWRNAEWEESNRRYNDENAWRNAEWEESNRRYEEETEYRNSRDKAADDQWQKKFDARYGNTSTGGSGGSGGSSGGSGNKPSGNSSSGGAGGSGVKPTTPSLPNSVVTKVKSFGTEKGQADYLASEVNKGTITEDQAMALLEQYGVTDIVNRKWEMVDNGGINWFGIGIDADAKVRDETGKVYTLAELRKELTKTMSTKEANAWIKKLMKELGI